MDPLVLKAFGRELEKTSGAEAAFRLLDRGRSLAGAAPGALRPPRVGSFGVKTVAAAAPTKVAVFDAVASSADLKSGIEEPTPTPEPKRRKVAFEGPTSQDIHGNIFEAMDGPGLKQTLKDLPVVIAAQGIAWGLGKTIADHIAENAARNTMAGTPAPGWVKHLPAAASIASGVGAYALGRVRQGMFDRREEARRQAKAKK